MCFFCFKETSSGADVALVIDYATSPEVVKQLSNFVNTIIDGLDISPRGVHISLITYGSNASIVFPFNELKGPLMTRDAVKSLVEEATPMSGKPRIDTALQLADEKLFTLEGGARPGVPRVRNIFDFQEPCRFTLIIDASVLFCFYSSLFCCLWM